MNRIFSTLVAFSATMISIQAQNPILNSRPSELNKVIYLDFDGQVVSGTSWNNGNTVNAQPSTVSNAAKIQIWQRVSEDYRPFDVNITTDETRFNNALPNRRMRIIFTPTSGWYGNAGGVAYVSSFSWGGTPGTPCWVFEDKLNFSSKSMAEAASHEAGHTLSLRHQSRYSSTCAKLAEYHTGWGTGQTGWAPIMGVGYNRNFTVWHNGQSAVSCNTIQNDHSAAHITGMNFLNFLPDEAGSTLSSAKYLSLTTTLTVDSGIITQPTDIDAYKFSLCETGYVSVNAQPYALDTINYTGANLDVKLNIYNANGTLLAGDSNLTRLNARAGVNLGPGTYYFTIDGGHSGNYSDYGSLGKYYLSVKATKPPALTAGILTSTICGGQTATLQAVPSGTVANYLWTVSGNTSFTSSAAVPSSSFASGSHTVTLLVSSSTYSGCPVTTIMDVTTSPAISVSGGSVICPPQALTLMASGAQSYSWQPTNSTGPLKIVNENSPTSFTVTGTNGICTGSTVVTISVNPTFTLGLTTTKTIVCKGDTATLKASGASSYTLSPGLIQTNPMVVSPGISANYYVTGKVGACEKTAMVTILVVQPATIGINPSTAVACVGDTIQVAVSGISNYTIQPGNFVNTTAEYMPLATTVYTVSGYNVSLCPVPQATTEIQVLTCQDTTLEVSLKEIDGLLLHVYPNPAKNELTIESAAGNHITVTTVHGALIFDGSSDLQTVHLNCSNWARGLYLVQIRNSTGAVRTEKVLLE